MDEIGGVKVTANDILDRLIEYYNDTRQWVCYPELRIGTGLKIYRNDNHQQRIDLWVLNCYPSKKFERIAFEVKISRGDFIHEINTPDKRQAALKLSNYYYFATPKGLVKPEEIPPECGLVEIDPDSDKLRWKAKAPRRETENPSWRFLAQLARTANGGTKIANLKDSLDFYTNMANRLKKENDSLKKRLIEMGG